jgi:hypothetical protein
MLLFIGIFAAGIAALLWAQHLDIECVYPREPVKNAPFKSAARPSFEAAVSQFNGKFV